MVVYLADFSNWHYKWSSFKYNGENRKSDYYCNNDHFLDFSQTISFFCFKDEAIFCLIKRALSWGFIQFFRKIKLKYHEILAIF
jgi:hypothetical protein